STLVFGTPLVVFGLQSKLLADTDYGLAWCAVIFAIVYALAAWFVLRRAGERLRVLAQAFAALAIGFATLAIPLAFDARWSSASWALEGAALVWVGWRQGRLLARIAGSVLQLIAGAAWLWHGLIMTEWLVSDWLGTVMLASAGLLSSRVLSLPADDAEGPPGARFLSIALGVWGLLWWFGAGAAQIVVTASSASTLGALLLLVAISALCLEWLGARLPWAFARAAVCCLPALLVILAIGSALSVNHPFTSLAALAWPCALCALIFILRLRKEQRGALTDSAHLLVLWLTTALVSWEFARLCGRWIAPLESWLEATWLLIPSVSVACLLIAKRRGTWPLAARHRLYLHFGALPVLFTLAIGVLWLSVRAPGAAWPIPYMPLLNPVDLLSVAALAVMLMWWRACEEINGAGLQAGMAIAGLVLSFVWLNAALLRSLYFWAGVPYELSVQMNSTSVQASLSVLWASTALLAMLAGSRASERAVWMSGVSLMAVVVAKLLLVDLASSGTIARIVSFIGVGLLMMLVGYLAPVPPRQVDVATA
ncbi:MAG: putative membrane protein, partial [Gammaproteobacteria bacterium]